MKRSQSLVEGTGNAELEIAALQLLGDLARYTAEELELDARQCFDQARQADGSSRRMSMVVRRAPVAAGTWSPLRNVRASDLADSAVW